MTYQHQQSPVAAHQRMIVAVVFMTAVVVMYCFTADPPSPWIFPLWLGGILLSWGITRFWHGRI